MQSAAHLFDVVHHGALDVVQLALHRVNPVRARVVVVVVQLAPQHGGKLFVQSKWNRAVNGVAKLGGRGGVRVGSIEDVDENEVITAGCHDRKAVVEGWEYEGQFFFASLGNIFPSLEPVSYC